MVLNNKRGFTLLEILLATLLLSIVVVALLGTIRLGMRSVQKAETKVQELDTVRSLYLNLERQLSSLVPSTKWVDGKRFVWFEGDERGFQFLSTSSLWGNKDSFVEVSYIIEDTDEGIQLIEQERLPAEEEGVSILLMDNIEEIGFAYLNNELEWTDEFKESDVFPLAVAMSIKSRGIEREMVFPIYVGKRNNISMSKVEVIDVLEELKEMFR
jgi:general secretion pathway protein J